MNLDAVLRSNRGSGCDVEDGRHACLVTSAVVPHRVLQVGDPIPSITTLSLCNGPSCTIATPPPSPKAFHCVSVAACLPIAYGCVRGELHCEPVSSDGGLSCTCNVLD